MSNYNSNQDVSDPTFDSQGNAAVGQFYSSGGKNDTTGREPFEDTSRDFIGQSGNNVGSSLRDGGNYDSSATSGQYDSGAVGGGQYDSGATGGIGGGSGGRREEIATEVETGRGMTGSGPTFGGEGLSGQTGDNYGSNTSAGNYAQDTSNLDQGAAGGLTGDNYASSGAGGITGDNVDKSAGYGQDSGNPGNMGVGGYGGERGNVVSGGAAGTDRFDSNYGDGVGGDKRFGQEDEETYGNPSGKKVTSNQGIGRHGDDFTGGFAATGGAYTNESAKTGLTGREGTATGVQDQNAQPTQHQGFIGKVMNVLGGHNNSGNA